VHSHSSSVIAFGLVKNPPPRAVCHTCGFLNDGAPVFDRDVAGPATNLLISNSDLGISLARSLGASNVVLMRSHGSTVVGGSIAQAVYRVVYTEGNARIQATALRLGAVTFLSGEESEAAEIGSLPQVERSWEFWKSQVAVD